MIVYYNGQFLPKEEVCISPDDRGFVFADGVYEVACAYEGRMFELDAHLDRLDHSLREIRMTPPPRDELKHIATELLHRTGFRDRHAKLYMQVTRGVAPRQHAFPANETTPTVYASAEAYQLPETQWERGVKVILHPDLRWARCDIKSVALLPNVMASQRAREEGAYEAVLEREGVVTEGSHSTFVGVFDRTVLTHPLTNRILPSVTREVVLDLCDDLGIPVEEAAIEVARLEEADELMLLGTTTGVMPVVRVGEKPVGDGRPGAITRQLQQAFRRAVGV